MIIYKKNIKSEKINYVYTYHRVLLLTSLLDILFRCPSTVYSPLKHSRQYLNLNPISK